MYWRKLTRKVRGCSIESLTWPDWSADVKIAYWRRLCRLRICLPWHQGTPWRAAQEFCCRGKWLLQGSWHSVWSQWTPARRFSQELCRWRRWSPLKRKQQRLWGKRQPSTSSRVCRQSPRSAQGQTFLMVKDALPSFRAFSALQIGAPRKSLLKQESD